MNTPTIAARASAGPRGRLLNAQQIATEIFNTPSRERWVKQTVAPAKKIKLGHSSVFWWEQDVLDRINQSCG